MIVNTFVHNQWAGKVTGVRGHDTNGKVCEDLFCARPVLCCSTFSNVMIGFDLPIERLSCVVDPILV